MEQGATPVPGPDRTWLVALAAALWGTDALLRAPLAGALPASTIVFWEHVVIVVVLVPLLPAALRAFRAASHRDRAALVVIGAGASAVATALFTEAFRFGDPVTPVVLQKLQPLIAVAVAALLLGERVRSGYWLFAVPALAGAWFMAFRDPFSAAPQAVTAALLAVGAAALWALGTVLGRLVGPRIAPRDVTVLRFAIGLPASAVVLAVDGGPLAVTPAQLGPLVLLALVPGLLGLALYYVGLRTTPAARATLAEMAFPVTAVLIGVAFLGAQPAWTQWLGLAVVVASVTALGLRERGRAPVVTAAAATSAAP
ncbi:MAG: Permease of the drug/metabolite transporter (DMT) superfamily [uncultured Pseudonocardia sp.]|uniref:Permease of the drug/metabolite transporter (DMT) superfamily n=1 Tax=uncultured Pseudonocardia sp. TaxID=211455 RepID=A0A6J4Q695_9PSEU|nr:MAG: Permease of the drug/metabolite transporter (DMT) superfamily [uncultured Pseudonocardia sp.]